MGPRGFIFSSYCLLGDSLSAARRAFRSVYRIPPRVVSKTYQRKTLVAGFFIGLYLSILILSFLNPPSNSWSEAETDEVSIEAWVDDMAMRRGTSRVQRPDIVH